MLVRASPVFAHAFLERASLPVGSGYGLAARALDHLHRGRGAVVQHNRSAWRERRRDRHGQAACRVRQQLSLGTYTANWHVTSVNTHTTQGNYKFTVAH